MELKEYIVTLWRREDLDDFYDDMETPGGSLYIPDRNVDVSVRRTISRNTHYMLTDEEAEELRKDERVRGVGAAGEGMPLKFFGYSESGDWKRSNATPGSTENNWGLYRSVIGPNAENGNWGIDGTVTTNASFNITASGKNVDVLIVDGHVRPDHPEFAVNPDGTGGSRVNQFNWFSLASQIGAGTNDTYIYGGHTTTIGLIGADHGTHVAGTAAGNTLGWARDANIFNIEIYTESGQPNYYGQGGTNAILTTETMMDFIREWHNTKAINPETGRRNPTITNHSYGTEYGKTYIDSLAGTWRIAACNYRGTLDTKSAGTTFSDAELEARGLNVPANGEWEYPSCSPSTSGGRRADYISDMEDAVADGIIIIGAAGNSSLRSVNSSDQDFNNIFYFSQNDAIVDPPNELNPYYHRYDQSWSPDGMTNHEDIIVVGTLDRYLNDRKATFSHCGSIITLYAPGYGILSAVNSSGDVSDPRNASYGLEKKSGTSMSSPQVCGVIALLAESNQNLTQSEAKEWLVSKATTSEMFDSGTFDVTDFVSLQGSDNRILFWENQRPEAGTTVPKLNTKARPTSSRVWPRPRIRAKG
jgi:hypothetical protein